MKLRVSSWIENRLSSYTPRSLAPYARRVLYVHQELDYEIHTVSKLYTANLIELQIPIQVEQGAPRDALCVSES